MDELLNQFHLLNNRMDMVWNRVFKKLESSGEKKPHEGETEAEDRKEKSPVHDTVGGISMPWLPTNNFTGSRFMQHFPIMGGGYHHRVEGSFYAERGDMGDHMMDDAARRVRVDVTDYHGKLEPDVFQDWITSMED